jgi:O-antigen ligase
MSSETNTDYQSLAAPRKKGGANSPEQTSLTPSGASNPPTHEPEHSQNLINPYRSTPEEFPSESFSELSREKETDQTEIFLSDEQKIAQLPFSEQGKARRKQKDGARDRELLDDDNWLRRNGHTFSYVGLYLFSILVLFRPYELIPGLEFLAFTAYYFAIATLAIYIPTQLATEGNLTTMSTEVKAALALAAIALITMPIAKDPGMAWDSFNEPFIKAVLMFIVMVNVIRSRGRLLGMLWLSLAIGVVLSYLALGMYMRGEMTVEGYRVGDVIGGMFENPNEMSMHLIMMIPIAVTLGLGSRNRLMKIVYFATAIIMLSANFITFSRGGFLGLLGSLGVLAWKLGRKNRLNVTIVGVIATGLTLLLAPGNFGIRVLSIFIPGLDAVGSSDQRRELLERSIIVTLRNPWGIGIGNFPIVGIRNLVSHNAYTQVSAELGLLGLAAYLVFMISPFRKLAAIERTLFEKDDHGWFYYLSVGLQSSIIAYMISSFFASVAYNWFIYYVIAYAVAFRRVYSLETET